MTISENNGYKVAQSFVRILSDNNTRDIRKFVCRVNFGSNYVGTVGNKSSSLCGIT